MRRRRLSIPLIADITIIFCSCRYINASFLTVHSYGNLLQPMNRYTKMHLTNLQESTDSGCFNPYPSWLTTHEKISNILICGDGDLSYSASIAKDCYNSGISMIVSVLEDENTHNRVYEDSQKNSATIRECHYPIVFGVDATKLPTHFPATIFDRIVFNFPHWKGKANHKHNRWVQSY